MALSGVTPAEKLATFTANSPLLSLDKDLPKPSSYPVRMAPPSIVAPEPKTKAKFVHNYDRDSGATA